MKRRFFCLLPAFLGMAVMASPGAEEPGFPGVQGWELTVSPDVYVPANLWDLINGAAETYLSYDFVDLHLADYRNGTGTLVHAEIYRHSNPDNAFGIYSAERSPDYTFLEIGVQGYLEEGVLNYFTGQYYVKLYSTDSGQEVQEALRLIGQAVSENLAQDNLWPAILGSFPEKGRLENKEHYVRENFIGLDFLHSAFTAEYEEGYKLFVIDAGSRDQLLEMVRSYLEFTKQDLDPEKEKSLIITDKYNGDIPVGLKGSYLAGILDVKPGAMDNLKALLAKLPAE
jgi:hypothetical protein